MTQSLPTYPPAKDPATPVGLFYSKRQEGPPVFTAVLPSGDHAWLVTRFADVRAVLSDPVFSRDLSYPGAPKLVASGDFTAGDASILNMDPPNHTRLRRLAAKAFTARRVEALRGRVQEITDQLLDDMSRLSPPVDLIDEFAFPLPMNVICELLGFPLELRARFRAASKVIIAPMQHTAEEVAAAVGELTADMAAVVVDKRQHPGDDLLTALIQARDDHDKLSETELVTLANTLVFAGHETTVSLISMAVVLLLQHPDQLAALQADPALVPAAIEEVLRFDGPAGTTLLRVATADVEVGGVTIKRGDAIMAITGAANFDPDHFTDPEQFDIKRADNPHMGFGHGIHFCLGASLARIEGQIGIETLFRRFPDLRLAVPPAEIPWRPAMSVRGPASVPVTW